MRDDLDEAEFNLDLELASFFKRKIRDLEADCDSLCRIRSRFTESAYLDVGTERRSGDRIGENDDCARQQRNAEFDEKFVIVVSQCN